MKIYMLEYYKGRNQPSLTLGQEYESAEIGEALAEWLVEHGKAKVIKVVKPVEKVKEERQPAPPKKTQPAKKTQATQRKPRRSTKK